MKSNTASKIVVVGGGAAGYLTALYIKKLYSGCEITVIEDPNLPPIQVGESGNVLFTQVLEFLEINFIDWIKKTDGLIKLGGVLEGWRGDEKSFFHSRVSRYQDFFINQDQSDLEYLKSLIQMDVPLWTNFLHGFSWKNKKIPYNERKFFTWPTTMFHFDSHKNAEYLKSISMSRGINVVQGKVYTHTKNSNGTLESVILDSEHVIHGDWFFDCTGMAKILLKKIYNVRYNDYSNYFLARSVITWMDDEEKRFATRIKSRKYGWQWSIDTRSRQGNGYVYSKDFIDTESAIAEIGKDKTILASFDWPIEYTDTISIKNVIGVGLSCGFLEPLEANGILMIAKTLNIIEKHWNPYGAKETNERINFEIRNSIIEIIEFLCLHYQCDRNDTDFWRCFKSRDYNLPFNLKDKITDLTDFIEKDKSKLDFNYDNYSIESWLMILQSIKKFDNNFKINSKVLENYNHIQTTYINLLNDSSDLNSWVKGMNE